MDVQVVGWIDEQVDRLMDEQVGKWMDDWMAKYMMAEWMSVWCLDVDGWI